jgi:hypothetical protein
MRGLESTMSASTRDVNPVEAPPPAFSNRACVQGRSKKTKCDMARSNCRTLHTHQNLVRFSHETKKTISTHAGKEAADTRQAGQAPFDAAGTPARGTAESALFSEHHQTCDGSTQGDERCVISHDLAIHLVEVYFAEVAPWLPVLHNP